MTSLIGTICSACSAYVAADWQFCRGCGQPSQGAELVDPHTPAMAAAFSPGEEYGGIPLTHGFAPAAFESVDALGQDLAHRAPPVAPSVPAAHHPTQIFAPASFLPSAPISRRWRAPKPLASIVTVVALVGGLIAFGAITRNDLTHTRSTLASTRTTLATTQADLKAAQANIDMLTAEKATLETDLAAAKSDLADTTSSLSSTRATLEGAQDTVTQQENKIGDLKTCLDGVSSALIDLANGYYQSAISGLQGVSGQCQRARNNY